MAGGGDSVVRHFEPSSHEFQSGKPMFLRPLFFALFAAALVLQPIGFARAAKNSLTVGLVVEPEGLDPTIAAPTTIREVTWLNIYEGLVRLDENGHVLPLLASSWTVSDDGLTYSFKLQPNVKFHDGTPFDSSIVNSRSIAPARRIRPTPRSSSSSPSPASRHPIR